MFSTSALAFSVNVINLCFNDWLNQLFCMSLIIFPYSINRPLKSCWYSSSFVLMTLIFLHSSFNKIIVSYKLLVFCFSWVAIDNIFTLCSSSVFLICLLFQIFWLVFLSGAHASIPGLSLHIPLDTYWFIATCLYSLDWWWLTFFWFVNNY